VLIAILEQGSRITPGSSPALNHALRVTRQGTSGKPKEDRAKSSCYHHDYCRGSLGLADGIAHRVVCMKQCTSEGMRLERAKAHVLPHIAPLILLHRNREKASRTSTLSRTNWLSAASSTLCLPMSFTVDAPTWTANVRRRIISLAFHFLSLQFPSFHAVGSPIIIALRATLEVTSLLSSEPDNCEAGFRSKHEDQCYKRERTFAGQPAPILRSQGSKHGFS